MFSRKGRIYSFGSLTLAGLVASLVNVATQSPEATVAAGAITATAAQSGIFSILQNKGFELTLKLLENLGAISTNLATDDARQILVKVAESLNKSAENQNHDIAKAVRQAILSIIKNEKAEIEDKDNKASLEKILKTTEATWAWIELLEQDNLITITEEKIPHFFAVKAEDIAKIESPVTESQWKLFLLEIARQNNCNLTQKSLNQISNSLHKKFPQSLREVFAQDFANEGVAYGKLLLALVGDLSASQEEIAVAIENVSEKQDKYHSAEMRWLRKIYKEIKKPPAPPTLPKRIAADSFPTHTNFFTGRGDVLGNIKKELKKTHRATLHGISGLGKTSVVLEFAKRAEDDYKHLIFLRATKGNAVSSFARLAEKVDEETKKLEKDADKATIFKTWLEENDGWLLLIDNVDVPSEVKDFLPANLRGDILASGNSSEMTTLGNEVEINKMKSENGELLLYRRAKTLSGLADEEIKTRLENEPETEQIAVKKIVKEFDGLPLALNLAGAYIHKFNKKFADYENLYKTSAHKLLEKQDINDQYQNDSVAKAFSLAFDTISTPESDNDESKQIAESAVLFLKTASFLNPEAIPLEIFTEILKKQNDSAKELSQDELFLDEVFAKIAQFDLFEKDSNKNTINIHRLVQKVIFNKIKPENDETLFKQILKVLIALFPPADFFNEDFLLFTNHTLTAIENGNKLKVGSGISEVLRDHIENYQKGIDRMHQAQKSFQQDLELPENFSDKENIEYLAKLSMKAFFNKLAGRYNEAIVEYQEAILITEQTIGKKHFYYSTLLIHLASAFSKQGRFNEAIEKHKEAIKIDEKTLGKEHPQYANHLNNLALVYDSQGRYAEAMPLYEEAVRILVKVLGENHPSTQTVKGNLENCRNLAEKE